MALKAFLLDALSSSPAYSKSMVEPEPGKVLHDRRERLFGPLVVIVVTPSPFPLQNNIKVY